MIAASTPDRSSGKLLSVSTDGHVKDLQRSDLGTLFASGDLVVANDAATIPASLQGQHEPSEASIEIRLAAFVDVHDLTRFVAVAFGDGDHRSRTEDRPEPPVLAPGDRLQLGPLTAVVERLLDHPRLIELRFQGDTAHVLAGIAYHGQVIQYSHVPQRLALWNVWTNLAARPFAFEAPSAGFALDWRTLAMWRRRGIQLATLTHAAGISSTGDPALDERLPLDEPYEIPEATADAIARTSANGGRVIAIGTTVVRALESATSVAGDVTPGPGVASGRIGQTTPIRVVDTILSGVHEPGESHYELLRAFASDVILRQTHATATKRDYQTHEFGDNVLIERRRAA